MKKVLFYGETAKYSLHGVSISNDLFLDDLSKTFEIQKVEERSFLSGYGKVGLSKIINYVGSLREAISVARSGSFDFFYSVLSLSVQGAIKSLLMLMCIKLVSPKTKIITHIHRGDFYSKAKSSAVLHFLFKRAVMLSYRTILISRQQVTHFNEVEFLGVSNYVYVANSINGVQLDQAELSFDCESCDEYYLYLSNYIQEKGIYDLLSVWRGLDNKIRLKCFGGETPGISISNLKTDFLSESAEFHSSIYDTEKFKVIASSKALILPSWNEGAPLVILEAMSLGVPVLASDVGFIREMVGDEYPFLFEARNTQALQDTILRFDALSCEEKEVIGDNLKQRFLLEYSREQRVSDYLAAFS